MDYKYGISNLQRTSLWNAEDKGLQRRIAYYNTHKTPFIPEKEYPRLKRIQENAQLREIFNHSLPPQTM